MIDDAEPLTPQQVYQIEREKALARGSRVLPHRNDLGQVVSGQASKEQLAEAKKAFEQATQQKTHHHKRK